MHQNKSKIAKNRIFSARGPIATPGPPADLAKIVPWIRTRGCWILDTPM